MAGPFCGEVLVRFVPWRSLALSMMRVTARAGLLTSMLPGCGSRSGLLVSAQRDGDPSTAGDEGVGAPMLPLIGFLGDCFGSSPPPIYVVTRTAVPLLLAFDPSTATFAALPPAACATALTPPSGMAVDRSGTAYLLLGVGANAVGSRTPTMQRIALGTGACAPLSILAMPPAPLLSGLAFAENGDGKGETLYAVAQPTGLPAPASAGLASVDATLGNTQPVGALAPAPIPRTDPFLIGTAAGELFAYYPDPSAPVLARVDRVSGRTTAQWSPSGVSGVVSGVAFWGGDFYLFQWLGMTEVLRFRPRDRSLALVARRNEPISGATSSTCSPLR